MDERSRAAALPSNPGEQSPERSVEAAGTAGVPRRGRLVRVLTMGLSTPIDLWRASGRTEPAVEVAGSGPEAAGRSGRVDFEAFYRSQYASVVRLAYSLCGSMQIAEELTQEGFVTAHERWRRIETFDRPDLWVRRVVINRSISFRRREASERRAVERIRVEREEDIEPVVGDETVWEAMRELSPRQAEVLALFYVEDQPLSSVAEILDLGPETVKTHLKRGRAALAARLAAKGHRR